MTLEQTKGSFKLLGVVTGIQKENAVRSGKTNSGKPYKSVRFGIKTSKTNTIYVELFGMERDNIYAYSSTKKDTKKFPWAKRNAKLPDTYHLIGTNCSFDKDEKGKLVRKTLVEMDAVEYITDNLTDGDSVFVNGEIDFSEFENKQGEKVQQTRYNIRSIGLLSKPVNFDAEDFQETSFFEQTIVVTDTDVTDEKTFLNAYIIKYGEEFVPAQFVIDGERNPKLSKAIPKLLKFGDEIKVYGNVVNAVEIDESSEAVTDNDDPFGSESNKMSGGIRNYIQMLQVVGVEKDTWQEGKYSEDDFAKEQAVEDFGEDGDNSDPFNDDGDVSDDTDDLPW